jgi:hypothetical protein
MEIERRYFADTPELRAAEGEDEKKSLRGTGIVFNSWSEDLGGFREMILPEAVDGVIDGADIRSFFNHDPSLVLGRTKAGTMRVNVESGGVRYEVDLPETSAGRDVHESTRRGDVTGSSFQFSVAEDGDTWTERAGKVERKIHKLAGVYEIGPVSLPAYPRAKVSARALECARSLTEAEQEAADAAERQAAVDLEHETLRDKLAVLDADIL